MSKIISIHSFRGGTGKSNITASMAALLASEGQRVGVIDTDIQSPGIHVLLGLKETEVKHSLNEYLWGKCAIEEAAHDVTDNVVRGVDGKVEGQPLDISKGRIFLIPSSMKAGEIARVLREGCDVDMLRDGIRNLVDALKLDVLLIDTHPGLNEETLLSIATSDGLIVVMRPDQQDFQGTRVAVEVARKLGIEKMVIVVNKTSNIFDQAAVKEEVSTIYKAEVAAVLPHADEVMNLGSASVFAMRYPNHPITAAIKHTADLLLA
jgi:MinD-like ATPase involved in chromosome partitioning or flagellar assembly